MAKPKAQPIKKIVVAKGIAGMSIDEKISHERTTKSTCAGSAAFNASQPCKDAMAAWDTKTNNLEANQQSKNALLAQLLVLDQQEVTCLYEYDEAAATFVAAVRTAAGTDRSIVVGMGVALRADPVHHSDPFTPTGLKIDLLKTKRVPKLEWDAMPGATLYVAQMSTTPAVDASFTTILGPGKSRMPVMVPGQLYSFRVAAMGKDGKQSAWSALVQFSV